MATQIRTKKLSETEWTVVDDVVSGSYVRRTVDMSAPASEVMFNNREGIWSARFARNDSFQIFDDGELVFDGKVYEIKTAEKQQTLTVIAWQKEYMKLYDTFCMESEKHFGHSAWRWGGEEIFDVDTQTATLKTEGLRPEEIFLAGLGLRTEIQHFFDTIDVILDSESNTSLLTSGVSTEKEGVRMLQLTKADEDTYESEGHVITKTLTNGIEGFNVAPDASSVRVRMSGYEPNSTSVEVEASIDGGSSWSAAQVATYDGSTGLWDDLTFAGGADNEVRLRFTLKTSDPAETPTIRYFRCTIFHDVSDTGITEGTIDPYEDPDTENDTAGGEYNKRNRLEVCEGAVKATVAPAGEQYTHWFAWIDRHGAAHFRNPATYYAEESGIILSRELGTADDIELTTVGQIINNLVYVGEGVGSLGTVTIHETGENFYATGSPDGIMRNQPSIDTYGEIQGMVVEKNVFSISHANKRAVSIARLLQQPQRAIVAKLNPNQDLATEVGMKVRVQSPKMDEDIAVRVLAESFSFDSTGMTQRNLELGNNIPRINNVLAALRKGFQSQNLDGKPAAPPSVSFSDNIDKDHPAELAFYLPEAATIRSVGLHLKTLPFRTFSRVTGEGSAHDHPITGKASGAGGISVLRKTQTIKDRGTSFEFGAEQVGLQLDGTLEALAQSIGGDVALQAIAADDPVGIRPDDLPSWEVDGDFGTWDGMLGLHDAVNDQIDYALVEVHGWINDENYSAFRVDVRIVDQTSGTVVLGERTNHHVRLPPQSVINDYIPFSFISVVPINALVNVAANKLDIQLKPVDVGSGGASDKDLYMYANAYLVKQHLHSEGDLENDDSDVSGATASKTIDPPAITDAISHFDFFGETLVGYSEDDGGIGPIAYTQDAINYHEQHEHELDGFATDEESEHVHGQAHGIFEFDDDDDDGTGLIYPAGIQVFIKDYPDPGDNPDAQNLTEPFTRFGTRGKHSASLELQNMDLSVAFRDDSGNFAPGFKQVWVKSAADAGNGNPLGLGRFEAHLYIEQLGAIAL